MAPSRCSIILKIELLQLKWTFVNNVITIYDEETEAQWEKVAGIFPVQLPDLSLCLQQVAHVFYTNHALCCLKNTVLTSDGYSPQSHGPAAFRGPRAFQCSWPQIKCLGTQASGYCYAIVSFCVPKTPAKVLNKPKMTFSKYHSTDDLLVIKGNFSMEKPSKNRLNSMARLGITNSGTN